MSKTDFVFLADLATEFGLDRSNTRKYVLRQGVVPHKRRAPGAGSQRALALYTHEADLIRDTRQAEGYTSAGVTGATQVQASGFFYLIRLVPELDAGRIKLGFANDTTVRLAQHRTAAPTAVLVRSWPCRRSWEAAVMDCLTSNRCRLLGGEVYECDDVDALVRTADALFVMLPGPERRPPLSQHSLFNT